ncbi:Tyrosine recombinase XerD [subsurface metagenome]
MLPLLPEQVQDYIDDLEGSDAHRHTCATLLRTFYRWAYKFHHIPKGIENPTDLIKFPPDGRKSKMPRVLSDEEAGQVVNAGRTFEEKTMLRLLRNSGIRAGELRSLTKDMIYPPDKGIPQPSIRPSGKMGERKVWITDQLYHDLQTLAASKPGEYIFTDRRGKPLRKEGLFHRVQLCMKKAGIRGKKLGPYAFRHTFITGVITESGDLMLAKELAGHSRISTTERYTHLAPKHIAQGYAKLHPGESEAADSGEPCDKCLLWSQG